MRVLLLTLFACGGGDPIGPSEPVVDETAPSFHRDVRPLLDEHCVSCHTAGGIAPFALDDEEAAWAWKDAIVDSVATRRMPPWGMEPDCRETLGDLRLPDEHVAVFQGWAEAGFPEGDRADYTGTPVEPPVSVPPDLELYPAFAYTPDAAAGDDYRCQLLDHEFTETTFVLSDEALPDQLAEVHHVIAYVVTEDQLDDVAALEAVDEAPGYACFGGSGLASAAVIGGWAPGKQAGGGGITVDGGVAAARIPAGAKILLEMHYNSAAVAETTPDRSGFALWTLPAGETPEWLIWALPIADLNLYVPAGATDYVEGLTTRVPIDGRIIGSSPHMHLHGRALDTKLVRADGTEVCVSDVPAYDFAWQRQYVYPPEQQIPLSVTDEIQLTCVYDNAAEDQSGGAAPADLWWGEGTGDEMCLDYLTVATPYVGGDDPSVCAGFSDCYAGCAPGDAFCFMTCATGAGEACMNCNYDALFGDCVTSADHCLAEGTDLYFCTLDCPDLSSDYADCLYQDCRAEFDAYYSCFQPVFDSGVCAADHASCPGMEP